ncbi:class D sortase [Niallia sp. Krafla_26]|uniref:class D sortase n=1 Tax=Niallia sp. Krafla_26 TaxID=3064703 RepID=UPI003D170B06
MKKFAGLLIISGLIIVGLGGWQIFQTNQETEASLEEAKKVISDGSVEEVQQEEVGEREGRFTPAMGEVVGLLTIPELQAQLPIVEGTDPDELKKGVGHYKGSYYPNENGQIVLSGHRDTVFRKIGELEIGDTLEVHLPYGEFSYEITYTKIVGADDTSIITLQNDYEELILTTCYPFSYIGNAPDRYIIYAKKLEG